MKLQDLQTLDVPLNKLIAWEGNVRTTDPDRNINAMAASIEAHGLLQSLVVQATSRNRYMVVAGRRRLLALCQLQDSGKLPAKYQVPCRLAPEDADLTELSLAENVEREDMDPLDAAPNSPRLSIPASPLPISPFVLATPREPLKNASLSRGSVPYCRRLIERGKSIWTFCKLSLSAPIIKPRKRYGPVSPLGTATPTTSASYSVRKPSRPQMSA